MVLRQGEGSVVLYEHWAKGCVKQLDKDRPTFAPILKGEDCGGALY